MSNAVSPTVAAAISNSIRTNSIEIVSMGADDTDEIATLADDYAVVHDHPRGVVLDCWGTDADGDEWRVHVTT